MYVYKMKRVLWTFFVCLFVRQAHFILDDKCECGIIPKNRRIVGGTAVYPHGYPWLVSLMLGPKLHCGGAIITDRHVLTAGHCITFGLECRSRFEKYLSPGVDDELSANQADTVRSTVIVAHVKWVHYRDLAIYVGMHDRLDSNYDVMTAVSGVKHYNFTSNAVRDINDIAVLRLNKQLKFSDIVRPICLPNRDLDFKGLPLTVAGWGKTRQGALTSSRYLLETKVYLVDGTKCRKSATYRDNLASDTMMCAYSYGKDACQGDSGGPLFSTHPRTDNKIWYQVGIVSWGIDCAMPDYPGVYTVVSEYIPWIKEQTKDGVYCKG